MLPELLQGTDVGGFIIIQDSTSYSGRNLLKSFINAALNREELVHVLGFEVSEEELKDGLNGSSMKRLHFHNAYVDPLGWTEHPPFTVHQFTSNELTNLLKQTLQPKPVTLVIDSLSWILRHSSPPAICSTLQQLKKDKNSNSPRAAIRDNVSGGSRLTQSHDHEKLLSDTPGGAVRTIVSLLHSDMHQRGMVGSVCHLATSVVTVTPGLRGDEAVAKTTRRSKSGKVMQDEEIFSIKDDLTVTIHSKPSHPGTKQTDPDEPEEDPTANLTFNLRLSDTERKAKEKLALPFVFSKEKKTALLHSGPGSGRILYEPDANDDYDQEDPDDDLDV